MRPPSDPDSQVWHDNYLNHAADRILADVARIKSLVPTDSRILEYGAIPLLVTATLGELGYRVDALDIDPSRYAEPIESSGLSVVRCNVEVDAVPFESDTFDRVIFNELFKPCGSTRSSPCPRRSGF